MKMRLLVRLIKNKLFINFTLSILTIGLVLFVMELVCRVLYREELPKVQQNHHKLFCRYDPLLGWSHKPNTANFYTTKEYSTNESFNSKGLRGPEYSYEKNNDEFRILILGDSFAEGYTVEFEELFSEVLKNRLINKGINCQTINSGTGGYSTDQELLFFEKEGKKYKPDLTILMFCYNDVKYNNKLKYWRGYKPLFKLEKGNLILTNVPVPKPDIINRKVREKKYDIEVTGAWKITEALIVRLKKETSLIDSKLLIFYIPPKTSIYNKRSNADRFGLKLQNICRRNNIDFINPADVFKIEADKLKTKKKRLYFIKDGHWNVEGHKFVGSLLSDYIYMQYLESDHNEYNKIDFVQKMSSASYVPFTEKTVMYGSDSELIKENMTSMLIKSKSRNWISIPLMIDESGIYRLSVIKGGGGSWDILIDGEKYEQLKNVFLKFNGENTIPYPVYFDKGQHSIIFYSDNKMRRVDAWGSLKIEKLLNHTKQYVDTRKHWNVVNDYSKLLEIGDMFGGSYINVNIARDMALFSRNGYQFISYYNSEGYLVVGRRKLDSTYFEKYWIPIKVNKVPVMPTPPIDFSLSDPHNFISMQMDGNGYIHLAFGQHNSKLKYLRSKYPYEINKWSIPETHMINEEEENNVTYVRFIKLKSGNLLVVYRVGPAGRGFTRLLSYDINTKKWSKRYSTFITDNGNSSPYLWRPIVSPDGTIHLAWTWRVSKFNDLESMEMKKQNFSGFSNKNISYAKSLDEGKTWLRSDNSKYEIPINRGINDNHKAEVIENIPLGESFFNHYGSDYDTKSNPHFTYTRWNNASDQIAQQWHLYWNDNSWKSRPITNYSNRFEWTRAQQDGRASTYLMRPSILLSKDNTAIIISRSREFNNIVELYVSNTPNYDKWDRVIAYKGSVGGWEPQMDLDLWHESNKLDLLLLGVTDKIVRQAYEEKMNTRNYRKNDYGAKVMQIDSNLEENKGYMLEVDYRNMKQCLKKSGGQNL